MPMMAPAPPASRFTRTSGSPPSAPSRRSAVTARVIRTGVRTSAQAEEKVDGIAGAPVSGATSGRLGIRAGGAERQQRRDSGRLCSLAKEKTDASLPDPGGFRGRPDRSRRRLRRRALRRGPPPCAHLHAVLGRVRRAGARVPWRREDRRLPDRRLRGTRTRTRESRRNLGCRRCPSWVRPRSRCRPRRTPGATGSRGWTSSPGRSGWCRRWAPPENCSSWATASRRRSTGGTTSGTPTSPARSWSCW